MEDNSRTKKDDIDKLIKEAIIRNTALTAITIDAASYDDLLAEMMPLVLYPSTDTTKVLWYKDVCIYKRACKGCCRHG